MERFSWLSKWALNATRSVLVREGQRDIRQAEEEKAM